MFGEAAHHAPAIIFIDELDALLIKRGETGSQTDTRVVTTLLSLMDGLRRADGVMVIGTTNRLDVIEPAARRPGRFDRELFVGPPDVDGRLGRPDACVLLHGQPRCQGDSVRSSATQKLPRDGGCSACHGSAAK